MPGIYDLMQGIQQQGEQGRLRGLAQLAGKAYAAPPEQRQGLLNTLAQRGAPDMAMQAQQGFDKQDDNVHLQMAKRAKEVVALYKANPQMAQQIYQNGLIPLAARAGVASPPMQLDDSLIEGLTSLASAADAGSGDDLKSLRIGANGNYWAIRGGQFVDTGTPAAPNTVVRDQPGVPFDILDKRTGGSIYSQQQPQQGQPQQWAQNGASYQTPSGIVKLDGVAPEDMAAVQADMLSGGAQDNYALPPRDVSPQGRPPSRPDPSAAITPYQQAQLDMQQQRLEAAQQAAQRAAEAAQAAQAAQQQVAAGKAQKARVAAQDSVDAYIDAISTIDTMRSHPGYADLGTPMGDFATNVPVIRTDAKGANASLETLKSQIMINTLSKLKALSATGAAGFGALNQSEGDALRRAIANLDTAQSHADLDRAVLRVREVMQRSAERIAEAAGGLGQGAQPAAPQSGGVDDLLSKYGVK